ncbi:helix-turn-helix domain-containing protein [Paenibacillus sp. LHD-117]|uniref:helix-turn-helix domain-containing protein n=1 Tax=Paenibacillus sp. LHD-117 TaxID=3071412 RepID=UPI0027E19F44|nr:helix-turn-helix domain-containing protein [Paenibacillus sp. LHD-117]MDQ6419875.1 helix-turn-helix domain-containing protein [Paenibacillus sp. LHD-117]
MMIQKWRSRKEGETFRRSVFVKLLLSFMCILMIPVVIGALLYGRMEQALIDNAYESNQALLQQTRLTVDSRMNEVDQLTAQIAFDPMLQMFLYEENNRSNINNYTYIELIKNLKRYRTLSPFIDDYFVYLKESDRIVTTTIRTDMETFFRYINEYQNRSINEISEMLSSYHLRTYLPSEPIQYDQMRRNMITSISSLPMGDDSEVRGSLVVMIDEAQLLGQLRKSDHRETDFYIFGSDGQVLSTTAQHADALGGIVPKFRGGQGNFAATIGNNEMMISYTKSSQNNWTYVSVIPKPIVLAKVHETKTLAMLLVLLCMAGGLAVAYYLAYKNHRPIRELIHAILQGKNMTGIQIRNEFAFIKNELLSSIVEEKQMRGKISQQKPVIQSDFISRLMKGYVDTAKLTDKDYLFMDVSLPHPHYGVVLLQIDDCHNFIQDDSEREWTLMRFILINLSNELLQSNGYAIEMERDRVGILLNVAEPSAEEGNELDRVLKAIKSQMESKFRTSITVAVSGMKADLEQIAVAYGEAVTALEYKLLREQRDIMYYDSVKNAEHHYFYYSLETEAQLMNYAKSGDYGSVAKVLDHVFEINFQTRSISPEMGKCLFSELISTVLKLFNALGMDEKPFFDGESDPFKYMARIGSTEKMSEALKRLYGSICEKVAGERSDHSDVLAAKIRQYIENHFASNELSLTTIADHIGLNPSYLSTFYKKQSGHNVTEYITALRMKEAKALLSDSDLTVTQIALKVGFASDIGLIRVFKKAEGVTPGKYREILQNNGHDNEAVL